MRKQLGFTLVETVIVLGLLAIVMLGILFIFGGFNNVYNQQQAFINTSRSGSLAVNEVQNYVFQADLVVSSKIISGTTYTTNSTTLVLELPSINSTGDIITGKFDYVVFYLNGTSLYRLASPDAASSRTSGTRLLSNVVSSLSFTYDNSNLALATKIDMDLRTQAVGGGQTVTNRLRQQMYLRNVNS